MRLSRIGQALLLGLALLLALPLAQAKKPDDEDRNGRQERGKSVESQRYEDRRREETGSRYEDRRRYDDSQRGRSGPAQVEERRYEADYPSRGYEPRRDSRPGLSLSDAVRDAERRTGGRVLSAEPRDYDGRLVYRVKVLSPDGRVQILYIEAR